MSEVIRAAVDIYPAIAAGGSFVAGRTLLWAAQRHETQDRQAPNERIEDVNALHLDADPSLPPTATPAGDSLAEGFKQAALDAAGRAAPAPASPAETTKRDKGKPSREGVVGRVALRSLPFICAAMGYFVADTIDNPSHPVGAKPSVLFVVDRSGATKYGTDTTDNTSPKRRINSMLGAFKHKDGKFESVVFTASSGETDEVTLAESLKPEYDRTIGDAHLNAAFGRATARARQLKLNQEIDRHSTAVVVLTNGNNFQSETAEQRALETRTPVYVVNTSDTEEKQGRFQNIAQDTGGKYWGKDAKGKDVAAEVVDKLDPARLEKGLDINLVPPLALFITGLAFAYREAKLMPRTFRGLANIISKKRR